LSYDVYNLQICFISNQGDVSIIEFQATWQAGTFFWSNWTRGVYFSKS
jgi:hypothetical protein